MQGGDNGGGEAPHHNGSEYVEEPPWPNSTWEHVIKTQENEIDMKEEGAIGEKRGQSECVERSGNGKLRRREGIKCSLRDITPVSYEEYKESWDLEDQSKKCRRAVNCLLASCECRGKRGTNQGRGRRLAGKSICGRGDRDGRASRYWNRGPRDSEPG